ncbi:hypothetical protein [Hyphomonas sp.]|jgi:hypothetical protein|uniref:hypothetical protein n=1 Tax=Hyphomonas sp. TaxID=87 RepID=UPI0025C1ADE0|nr:hypothetical protein [Hyphomonas sp.]
MARISAFCAAALSVVACASLQSASANPAPEPVRVEQDATFVFNDGRVERLVEDRGETQVWATRRGREYVRSRNFTIPILEWEVSGVKGTRTVSGKPEKLWPPREGASSRFRVVTDIVPRDGAKSRSLQYWTCKAGRKRMETFAFAEIEVLPVNCERYTPSSMKLIERRGWLWSDEIGHYVERSSIKYTTGETEKVRLCTKIPGRTATDDRITEVVNKGC